MIKNKAEGFLGASWWRNQKETMHRYHCQKEQKVWSHEANDMTRVNRLTQSLMQIEGHFWRVRHQRPCNWHNYVFIHLQNIFSLQILHPHPEIRFHFRIVVSCNIRAISIFIQNPLINLNYLYTSVWTLDNKNENFHYPIIIINKMDIK